MTVFSKARDQRACSECSDFINKGDHYINKQGYNGYHLSNTCVKCVRVELDNIQQKEDQLVLETLTIGEMI